MKNKIHDYRAAREVSQGELAKILKISRQTVSALENQRYNPSVVLAFKIARYFNASIEDLFIFEEEYDE